MSSLLHRAIALTLLTMLLPVALLAKDPPKTEKITRAADPALTCDMTAVLWRAEYGEEHYARAFCKAGCAQYRQDEKGFTTAQLEECTEGVEQATKTFYGKGGKDRRCLDIKRDVQLIRAWYGQELDGVAWKDHFEKTYTWYGTRPRTSYSPTASKLKKELEGLRAKCYRMSKDEKRYASTLIAALKRGKISGKTPIVRTDMETHVDNPVAILRGAQRHEVVASGYARMQQYIPTVLDTPRALFTELSEDEREQIPKALRKLTYKASIQIGGDRFSHYCDHFYGDEDCGGGGIYTIYYFNEDAEIIATHTFGVACPFVYTRDADEAWSFQGEILRDLRSPSLEGAQTLPVRVTAEECARGIIQVRLTEEKPETTWLDAVHLQVGEHLISAEHCVEKPEATMCADDARYHVLERGDELVLEFRLSEGAQPACLAQDVTLHADGHYVPTR